jgi:hypothetical protein
MYRAYDIAKIGYLQVHNYSFSSAKIRAIFTVPYIALASFIVLSSRTYKYDLRHMPGSSHSTFQTHQK